MIPNERNAITAVACHRLEVRGSPMDARREDRLPIVMTGFLPHISANFPAKRLHNKPTNPETDKITPI